jgi:hypothetical protein
MGLTHFAFWRKSMARIVNIAYDLYASEQLPTATFSLSYDDKVPLEIYEEAFKTNLFSNKIVFDHPRYAIRKRYVSYHCRNKRIEIDIDEFVESWCHDDAVLKAIQDEFDSRTADLVKFYKLYNICTKVKPKDEK